jgi:response regulator RpfG family c-di-GMP phosphodiesterase
VLVLQATLRAAVEQHRLVTAERVLLGQTLHGSIQALTEVLSAVSPAAFGRATRLCRLVGELIVAAGIRDKWHVEVAAMLSQIACITLPPDTLFRHYRGEELSPEEAAMVERMPAIAEQVVGSIPRLEPVLAILRYQYKNYNGSGPPRDEVAGQDIPWGARALKLATDLDALTGEHTPRSAALRALRGRIGVYDPALLDLLGGIRESGQEADIQEIGLKEVRTGMIFAEDVKTRRGGLILARGQQATPGVIERLNNFSLTVGVQEPFKVILREARPPGGVAA